MLHAITYVFYFFWRHPHYCLEIQNWHILPWHMRCVTKEASMRRYFIIKTPSKKTPFNLGSLLFKKGEFDQALHYLQQRSALEPMHDQTEFFLGLSYGTKNMFDKSVHHLTRAATLNTALPQIHEYLGTALEQQHNLDAALDHFYKAIHNDPTNYKAHFHIGIIHHQQNKLEAALKAYDETTRLKPTYQPALLERANILTLLGRTDESIAIYTQLLEINGIEPTTLYNIAFALKKQGVYDKAIEIYNKVITLSPCNKQALLGVAHAYLALGDFEHGWTNLAAYNACNTSTNHFLKKSDAIKGKTIFIGAEWDRTDMIMLVRYAQHIKRQGGTVILQTPDNLAKLFKNCEYIDQIISAESGTTQKFHKYIPISSLPALFGATLKSVPSEVPYLHTDKETAQFWKNILDRDKSLAKIGLFLSSHEDTSVTADQQNIPPHLLAPLAQLDGVSFYNLQNTLYPFNFHNLPTTFVTHCFGQGFSNNDSDILNLAAIIQHLDLVITRDSLVAHLAGALGIRVWVLLPYKANWRWMQNRTDCPWYPTMKLFRQQEPGNWTSCITAVTTDLKDLLATKKNTA
jgi:tetratricopeptide (TPR) repeat protein